jgi:hypothetical protein
MNIQAFFAKNKTAIIVGGVVLVTCILGIVTVENTWNNLLSLQSLIYRTSSGITNTGYNAATVTPTTKVTTVADNNSITISNVVCNYTKTEEYVNGYTDYYQITVNGSASGPEAAAFSVSTNPTLAGDEYRTIDCGSWSKDTDSQNEFDCIRSSTDQATTWKAVFEYHDTHLDGDAAYDSFNYSIIAGLHPYKDDYYGNGFKSAIQSVTCGK